jgi:transposase
MTLPPPPSAEPAARTAAADQRRKSRGQVCLNAPSHRQIAKTLGVGAKTVDRDVAASNDASHGTAKQSNDKPTRIASNDALPELSGEQAAKLAQRKATGTAHKAGRSLRGVPAEDIEPLP